MSRIIEDRILETSTTTGTGAYTLAGAVTGFRPASAVCANGDTIEYYAEDVDSAGRPIGSWETGLGTWGTGNTLTRTVIYSSSNSGSAVSWTTGTRRIALSLTALGLTTSVASSLRANHNISGGGTITVDASYNVLWSTRFIVISNSRGLNTASSGYYDITCPTSGTITGVGGAANATATAAGVPLAGWEALYYILPLGSNNTTVASNFRLVGYTSDFNVPYDWVLICHRNADGGNGRVYFPKGVSLAPGTSATPSSLAINTATASAWQTARTLSLTGGVTGSVSIDGSANVSLAATVANDSHTHDTRYYTETEIQTADISVRRFLVNANGVPTSNLGAPTIAEMGLFDSQFNNKTEFFDIANVFLETSTDGTTWSTYSVTDTQKRILLSGDSAYSTIFIPNGTAYFRIRFRATTYVYLNALYAYFSSNGHQTQVQIYKKHDSGTYTQHTSSTTLVSGWPGHIYLPFPTIPFHNAGTLGTHFHETSIVFIPTWNGTYPSNNISLAKLQIWGGYPAGKRNLYSTDELGNATFPAAITATTNMTVTNLLAVGQTPSTDRGLFVRPTALTGTIQYGSVSSIVSTSGATALVAGLFADARTAVATYTVPTLAAAYIGNAVKGAGSTITSQHGIYIEDQTQGTNNYGVTSIVSSGTNKWNIYASGTAANYFAGKAVFGHTATANTGQINVLGTIRVVDASTETNALLTTVTSTTSTIETRYATPLIFGTNATERMRLEDSGVSILGGKPLVFYGATSGTISLSPTAVAGSTTLTLPATTGTLALTSQIPTVNDATLTLNVSGTGLSGSQTFTANQATAATFTVTSNATNANTASTIVARDGSGNFSAGTITAALAGNASTATTLETTRTINGVNFNGSANITIDQLRTLDDRTIAPADITTGYMKFGFTSFNNNNTSPYADYLHLRSYTDASGGLDNLVMFRKDAIGIRIWQQTYGSSTAYATYKDVAFTDQIPTVNNATLTMNVSGVGLSGSQTFTANQATAATFTVTSNATNLNTGSTIVSRDASGNFAAGTITAALAGNASSSTTVTGTQLGSTFHSLTVLSTQALWAQPAGYQTMVNATGSNGLPTSHGQNYFGYTVTSRRDTGNGYSALLTAYDNSQLWFTYNTVDTAYPTWRKVWHDGNLTNLNQLINGPGYIITESDTLATVTARGNTTTTTITHGGLTPSAGTNIDQIYSVTDSLTLSTSWQDTSVNAAELASGSYVVQVYVSDFAVNGGQYYTYYTGMMSWYASDTNETSSDEIVLHRAGHASNTGVVFLRILRTVTADASDLKLQISGTTANTGASNYIFKFRRLI